MRKCSLHVVGHISSKQASFKATDENKKFGFFFFLKFEEKEVSSINRIKQKWMIASANEKCEKKKGKILFSFFSLFLRQNLKLVEHLRLTNVLSVISTMIFEKNAKI